MQIWRSLISIDPDYTLDLVDLVECHFAVVSDHCLHFNYVRDTDLDKNLLKLPVYMKSYVIYANVQ